MVQSKIVLNNPYKHPFRNKIVFTTIIIITFHMEDRIQYQQLSKIIQFFKKLQVNKSPSNSPNMKNNFLQPISANKIVIKTYYQIKMHIPIKLQKLPQNKILNKFSKKTANKTMKKTISINTNKKVVSSLQSKTKNPCNTANYKEKKIQPLTFSCKNLNKSKIITNSENEKLNSLTKKENKECRKNKMKNNSKSIALLTHSRILEKE